MPGLALALLLCASPTAVKVAAPVFEVMDVPEAEVQYWVAVFANALRQQGLAVGTFESADLEATGNLRRVGPGGLQIAVHLQLPGGAPVAAFTMTAQTDKEIRDLFMVASQELAGEVFRRFEATPVAQKAEPLPPAPPRTATSTKVKVGVLGGVGVAVVGAGALAGGLALYIVAKDKVGGLARGEPASYFAAQQQASDARTFSTASLALLGTGGLMAVGGILYALYSGNVNTFFTLAPAFGAGEGGLVFSGVLP